jgi:hypothetical protein
MNKHTVSTLPVFGPAAPSLLTLRGIRCAEAGGDGTGAGGEITLTDDQVAALGGDKEKVTEFLKTFETDRLKHRQSVIAQKDAALKEFTELGLTPAQIKALNTAPAGAATAGAAAVDDKDVQQRIDDAIEQFKKDNKATSDARARSAEVRAQAADLQFINPLEALALVDSAELAKVSVNDAGDADSAGVKKLLEDLAKKSPHLLKPKDNTPGHRAAGIGGTGSAAPAEVRPGTDRLRSAYENASK